LEYQEHDASDAKQAQSEAVGHPCPKLERIHLTSIHLDESIVRALVRSLRTRYDSMHSKSGLSETFVSTKSCTFDAGATLSFPDLDGLSFPEFERVIDDQKERMIINLQDMF